MGTLSGEIPFCRMQSILAYIDLELNLCFKSDFDLNSIISSDFVGRGRGLPFFFLITVVLPVWLKKNLTLELCADFKLIPA